MDTRPGSVGGLDSERTKRVNDVLAAAWKDTRSVVKRGRRRLNRGRRTMGTGTADRLWPRGWHAMGNPRAAMTIGAKGDPGRTNVQDEAHTRTRLLRIGTYSRLSNPASEHFFRVEADMLKKMGEFNLWVADMEGCPLPGYTAKVHACKQPCHAATVGYTTKEKIAPTHPEYLFAVRRGNDLALNIIDPEQPLFRIEVFQKAVEFIDEWISQGPVMCHCNQGGSRAPSIALLWLAKRAEAINGWGYADAREAFTKEFMPDYAPRKGIVTFLTEKWAAIS